MSVFVSELIDQNENLILFIDDFHLADEDVQQLVKEMDRVIIASRNRTNLSKKVLCLIGISGDDSENLIDLLCMRFCIEIPERTKEKITQLTEGHPISMELLVRNYEFINFGVLKEFPSIQVEFQEDFFERILQETLSQEALALLKDLSVLNTKIETNIDIDCIENLYNNIPNFDKLYYELLDTGMLIKKEGIGEIYEFSFEHIQSALKSLADLKSHKKAIKYYHRKKEKYGENFDDYKEISFHETKINP